MVTSTFSKISFSYKNKSYYRVKIHVKNASPHLYFKNTTFNNFSQQLYISTPPSSLNHFSLNWKKNDFK